MLDFLQKVDGVQETTQDRIGGGSFVHDSGLYEVKIDKAYLVNSSSSKAVGVAIECSTVDGKVFKDTIYVTNGEGKNTYMTKDSKLAYLPGFETMSNLVYVTVGKEIAQLTPEDKVVEIYNAELAKKVPTTVKMLTELLGESLILGIAKVKAFKQAKNNATGKYEDTADIIESNELINVFNISGFTALELKAKATEIDFINKFQDVYTSEYVKDKTKKSKPGAAATGVTNTPPTKSLFGAGAQA